MGLGLLSFFSRFWGWRMVIFQLSRFYCKVAGKLIWSFYKVYPRIPKTVPETEVLKLSL